MTWRSYIFIRSRQNGKEDAPADVLLTIKKDGDNTVIAESVLDKNLIVAATASYFKLPRKIHVRKGGCSLQLPLVDYAGPGTLSAGASKSLESTGNYLDSNGVKSDISLQFGLAASEKRTDLASFGKKLKSFRWGIMVSSIGLVMILMRCRSCR